MSIRCKTLKQLLWNTSTLFVSELTNGVDCNHCGDVGRSKLVSCIRSRVLVSVKTPTAGALEIDLVSEEQSLQ